MHAVRIKEIEEIKCGHKKRYLTFHLTSENSEVHFLLFE